MVIPFLKRSFTSTESIIYFFLAVLLCLTMFLMLPWATVDGKGAPFFTALFTVVSAMCVTGLTIVNTATYFTPFGHWVIIVGMQIGGLGVITVITATLSMYGDKNNLPLQWQGYAKAERGYSSLGSELTDLLKFTFLTAIGLNIFFAVIFAIKFHFAYGFSWSESIHHGIFLGVSSGNNAGFVSIFPDSMMKFAGDKIILLSVCANIIIQGLGFNFLYALWRKERLNGYEKLVLWGVFISRLVCGILIWLVEKNNPDTLAPMGTINQMINSFHTSTLHATAGFNSINHGLMERASVLLAYVIMIVGAAAGSTGGGAKMGNIGLFFMWFWQIICQGKEDIEYNNETIPYETIKTAIRAVIVYMFILLSSTAVLYTTEGKILTQAGYGLEHIVFETASALGTVGSSLEKTADVSLSARFTLFGQIMMMLLMLIGRLSPLAFINLLGLKKEVLITSPVEADGYLVG